MKSNISHHLENLSNYDEESFQNDYPLLYRMFPGEFNFWVELRWNFLETLEKIGTAEDNWDKVALLNHKLARKKYDNKKLEAKIEQLKEELQIEREEITKFHEKSAEYSLKQVEEIKKRDQEIAELKQKLAQLENCQEPQTEMRIEALPKNINKQ